MKIIEFSPRKRFFAKEFNGFSIMKKLLLSCLALALGGALQAQWSISTLGVTNDTVNFDQTFSGVNNGVFAGSGLQSSPSTGQLDSDGWMVTGLSDGNTTWGGSHTSGDYAKGTSGGGVTSGGMYAFGVAAGDTAVGFQPTGGDWTPGTIVLRAINNTGFDADSFFISYDILINNNEGRANSFDFEYGVNSTSTTTAVSSLDYTSTATSQGSTSWVTVPRSAGVIANVPDGDTLYLIWAGSDASGSGSRDEFALDNIVVTIDSGSTGTVVGPATLPYYAISTINTEDANGEPDSLNVECWTSGVVVGIDMDGNTGLSFTIMEQDGSTIDGINIFNFNDVSGYVVQEGDSILTRGEVGFYNGLTQFTPDSIELLNQNNPIPDTVLVTTLSESTESELLRFENCIINAISGSNYTLISGTDTVVMRVDSDTDVDDSLSLNIGDSLCYVVGIGGQFDNSSPYFDGYQIFPRYYTDVDTSCGSGGTVTPGGGLPIYPIGTIETVDASGVADSLGVVCGIQGIVVGVDLQGSGSNNSFTVIDNTGGIGVFAFGGFTPAYTVTEGDEVIVYGEVDQFNGLAQISGDSMSIVSTGNSLPTTTIVTTLDESTESEYIEIHDLLIIDINGSNYDVTNGSDTLVMRVDSDTDVDDSLSLAIGDSICTLIGIGGQFDNSSPYLSGYQVFPHHYYDVDTCGGVVVPPGPAAPYYPIPDINNVDANGEPDSIGVTCWTSGVVLGVDLDGNAGLSFTLWDEEGINIFNFVDVSNYAVVEGDSLMVRGEIDFYNGLLELFVDSIEIINTGNPVPAHMVVDVPSEATESNPIFIASVSVIDTASWPTPGGSSSNVLLETCDGDTIIMRIDTDTDVDENWPNAPLGTFNVSGIGGQYDNAAPYFDNHQIFPMFASDIDTSSAPSSAAGLVLNELGANNVAAIADEHGDYDDWIEVFNTTNSSISLGNVYLTNDAGNWTKYHIPTGTSESTSAMGHTLIWADNEPAEGDLHTNFELDAAGGWVGLAYLDGCDVMVIDSVTYPALEADDSYGRWGDNGDSWFLYEADGTIVFPSPGFGNIIESVEEFAPETLHLFPNPTNTGMVYFTQYVSIEMFDMAGRSVMTANNVESVSVSNLEAGLYVIKTTEGKIARLVIE